MTSQLPDHVGVVVIGAGLSGIGAGYRLQTECPDRDYLILESRQRLGGTWDLFRYPGVRSDSDIFTFGFTFRPWRDDTSLADGPGIRRYIEETAAELGIEQQVRYGVRVRSASFATATALWTLTLETDTGPRELTCDFVIGAHGYYSYDAPYDAELPGLEDFAGPVVHPQSWPEDLDWTGKRVVVVGSGATAVTLVPAMAEAAAHVTMLQRTPTYVAAVPRRDRVAGLLQRLLPDMAAYRVIRAKNIAFQTLTYQFFRRFPEQGKKLLAGGVGKVAGPQWLDPHFSPPYDPWDQRLCAIPGADLFWALRSGEAAVVTGTIDRFVPEGVRLHDGRLLEADLVVTATGLQVDAVGGIRVHVDDQEVVAGEQLLWKGAMITRLPNYVRVIGYSNASWTLRADVSNLLACRVLNAMREADLAYVVPEPDEHSGPMGRRPLFDLDSGYLNRAADQIPDQGDRWPWLITQNYLRDRRQSLGGDLMRELRVVSRAELSAARPTLDAEAS